MTLDLNQNILSYSVNGESWGIAYQSIEPTMYQAVVSANDKHDSIQLLSYQNLECDF